MYVRIVLVLAGGISARAGGVSPRVNPRRTNPGAYAPGSCAVALALSFLLTPFSFKSQRSRFAFRDRSQCSPNAEGRCTLAETAADSSARSQSAGIHAVSNEPHAAVDLADIHAARMMTAGRDDNPNFVVSGKPSTDSVGRHVGVKYRIQVVSIAPTGAGTAVVAAVTIPTHPIRVDLPGISGTDAGEKLRRIRVFRLAVEVIVGSAYASFDEGTALFSDDGFGKSDGIAGSILHGSKIAEVQRLRAEQSAGFFTLIPGNRPVAAAEPIVGPGKIAFAEHTAIGVRRARESGNERRPGVGLSIPIAIPGEALPGDQVAGRGVISAGLSFRDDPACFPFEKCGLLDVGQQHHEPAMTAEAVIEKAAIVAGPEISDGNLVGRAGKVVEGIVMIMQGNT